MTDLLSNREKCYIYIDGGCWPNPGGDMLYAYSIFDKKLYDVITDNKDITKLFTDNGVKEFGVGIIGPASDDASNNTAEYLALYNTLTMLSLNRIVDSDIIVISDSLMLIKQMNGIYKVRGGHYSYLYTKCIAKKKWLESKSNCKFEFEHTPRENNISGFALEIFREKFYHS